jgi:hypothetical protein
MAQEHRAVALLPTAVAGARAPQAGDGAESSHANSDMRQELQVHAAIEIPLKGRLILQNYRAGQPS